MAQSKPILVTGAAGFIGFHLAKRLLDDGNSVVGLDNLSDYYDVQLKEARLSQLKKYDRFYFHKMDIIESQKMQDIFKEYCFDLIFHMAAQVGVRHSLTDPHSYVNSNLVGFVNILEGARHIKVKHLIFASSSSVYGGNTKVPFSIHDNTDRPLSLYAATKKANELMAYSYANLYSLPCTGLRFFTVYGPWGRPDMAPFLFTKSILEGRPISVFNSGKMCRDFTYIDDVVDGIMRVSKTNPQLKPEANFVPFHIYNIGNNQPVELLEFINIIEKVLGKKAEKKMFPVQPGDMMKTFSDIEDLQREFGFQPKITVEEGICRFAQWYRSYYN